MSEQKDKLRLELARILLDFEKIDDAFAGTIAIDKIIALFEVAHRQAIETMSICHEGELERVVREERERIIGVIENLNSIGYPYGGNYKEAVLRTLKEEK